MKNYDSIEINLLSNKEGSKTKLNFEFNSPNDSKQFVKNNLKNIIDDTVNPCNSKIKINIKVTYSTSKSKGTTYTETNITSTPSKDIYVSCNKAQEAVNDVENHLNAILYQ